MDEAIDKNAESGTESVEKDVRELHTTAGDEILVEFVGNRVGETKVDGEKRVLS